jgi:phosphoserine phosphatase
MRAFDKSTITNSIAIFDIDGTLRKTIDPWMLLHNYLGTDTRGSKILQGLGKQ